MRAIRASAEQSDEKRCNAPRERILELPDYSKINLWFTGYIMGGVSQVGPLLRNQVLTNRFASAFSFALNTNLNTTPCQLVSAASVRPLCSCPCVQILCSNRSWGIENNKGECFSFACHLHICLGSVGYISELNQTVESRQTNSPCLPGSCRQSISGCGKGIEGPWQNSSWETYGIAQCDSCAGLRLGTWYGNTEIRVDGHRVTWFLAE